MQHVKRAMIQSHLWVTCCTKESVEVEWTNWGWYLEDGTLRTLWTTKPSVSTVCSELISCKCKQRCVQCKCTKAGLPCSELYICSGGCENT